MTVSERPAHYPADGCQIDLDQGFGVEYRMMIRLSKKLIGYAARIGYRSTSYETSRATLDHLTKPIPTFWDFV